jgi:hypothetical protein
MLSVLAAPCVPTHFCHRLATGLCGHAEGEHRWHALRCPTNGREVDTGIDVDPLSFSGLRGEQLGRPECLEVHQLSDIKALVTDQAPPDPAE